MFFACYLPSAYLLHSTCIAAQKLPKLAVLTLVLLQGVAEAESRRAADAAEAAYQAAFKTDTPADEVALDREFERALSIGQRAFREVAVGQSPSASPCSTHASVLRRTSALLSHVLGSRLLGHILGSRLCWVA